MFTILADKASNQMLVLDGNGADFVLDKMPNHDYTYSESQNIFTQVTPLTVTVLPWLFTGL